MALRLFVSVIEPEEVVDNGAIDEEAIDKEAMHEGVIDEEAIDKEATHEVIDEDGADEAGMVYHHWGVPV